MSSREEQCKDNARQCLRVVEQLKEVANYPWHDTVGMGYLNKDQFVKVFSGDFLDEKTLSQMPSQVAEHVKGVVTGHLGRAYEAYRAKQGKDSIARHYKDAAKVLQEFLFDNLVQCACGPSEDPGEGTVPFKHPDIA